MDTFVKSLVGLFVVGGATVVGGVIGVPSAMVLSPSTPGGCGMEVLIAMVVGGFLGSAGGFVLGTVGYAAGLYRYGRGAEVEEE